MTKSNPVFKDYVTNTAFSLTLSKNMILWLTYIKNGEKESIPNGDFCKGFDSLRARGLMDSIVSAKGEHKRFLTNAGEKVYELLKLAELV